MTAHLYGSPGGFDHWPTEVPIRRTRPVPQPEPRVFTDVTEALFGVVFRPAGSTHAANPIRWERSGNTSYFIEKYPGDTDRLVTADDINNRFTAFIEVQA
ncbi:hypothetical protein [Nocardia wallacei]|uniref:hypothetical protein n=1 Tax=Nocardia wallacei TaxID=480035 RepID=UPI002454FF9B|nr:hypothetical protein [Nocardia wallacei]